MDGIMKKIGIFAIAVLMAAALASCGTSGEAAEGQAAPPQETLAYAGAPDGGGGDAAGDGETVSAAALAAAAGEYRVADTGQDKCYDNAYAIACPAESAAFYGQDAQYNGARPSYKTSADKLTVYDNNTGLTWQKTPDTNGDGKLDESDKLSWSAAKTFAASLNAKKFGGYSDWRMPSIKELYSLIDFRGTDPSGYMGADTSALTPFIDRAYFDFVYGDTSKGVRIIDAQYWSATKYAAPSHDGKTFGVNFADGRIKGYPGGFVFAKEFVRYVRGNASYGINIFADNGNGTVTDKATGLMWQQADSGYGMNWGAALAWVKAKNAAKYLGYSDWRLPNAKELQSIVDYARSPDTTSSAAINAVFISTPIKNEALKADYPEYWTGTTHIASNGYGSAGIYVAFGRAMGFMGGYWQDVHGTGAQRSDPKSGNPFSYPYGRGPQGDAIRINNFVRLVRN